MIYQPAEDSYLLQESVRRYVFGRVLDIGTGSGIQALEALKNPDVKQVVAVDINPEAVDALWQHVKDNNLRKVRVIHGDLFEHVEGHFDTIIFNPPYLPKDVREDTESQLATTGGKNGWEISKRFLQQASEFLFHDGKILFLFSSLTGKEKIEEILKHHLLQFEEVDREKIPNETLYVYRISKNVLLKKLQNKGVETIRYFNHGRRGNIYTGTIDRSKFVKKYIVTQKNILKVAIKEERLESEAEGRITNEAKWLKVLNKRGIGVKLMFHDDEFIVYEFVEGAFIHDWIKDHTKEDIQGVLREILAQCYVLDGLKVNKEEMHHPFKHIIIDANNFPTLLDFERCYETKKPHNVTQCVEFISRLKNELKQKGFTFEIKELRGLAKEYKDTGGETFGKLVKAIQ